MNIEFSMAVAQHLKPSHTTALIWSIEFGMTAVQHLKRASVVLWKPSTHGFTLSVLFLLEFVSQLSMFIIFDTVELLNLCHSQELKAESY